jgi:hypothetical protein
MLGEVYWTAFFEYLGLKATPVGFDVKDEHSFAVMLSNTTIPQNINKVADYFNLMIERAKQL